MTVSVRSHRRRKQYLDDYLEMTDQQLRDKWLVAVRIHNPPYQLLREKDNKLVVMGRFDVYTEALAKAIEYNNKDGGRYMIRGRTL